MATPAQLTQRILKVPFQVGGRGEIEYVTQPSVVAAQEIKAAVLTSNGERLMRPRLGSPFNAALFAPLAGDDLEFMAVELRKALVAQVRYSDITNVTIGTDPQGQLNVSVGYTPIAFAGTLVVNVPLVTAVVQQEA